MWTALLATAKFYKITLPFSILMAIVYFLNDILIDIYSINGAALSHNCCFYFYCFKNFIYKIKLNISPYSTNSVKVLASILVVYFT